MGHMAQCSGHSCQFAFVHDLSDSSPQGLDVFLCLDMLSTSTASSSKPALLLHSAGCPLFVLRLLASVLVVGSSFVGRFSVLPGYLSLLDGQGSSIIYLWITPCVSFSEPGSTFDIWLMTKGFERMGTRADGIIVTLSAILSGSQSPCTFAMHPWPAQWLV